MAAAKIRNRLIAVALVAVPAVTLICVLVGWCLSTTSAKRRLALEVQQWKAMPGPSALKAWLARTLDAEHNAASFYRRAFALLPESRTHVYELLNDPWKGETAVLEQIILDHQEMYGLLEEALQRPACGWNTEYGRGFWPNALYLGKMRELSDFLVVQAVAASRKGEEDKALKWIRSGLVLSQHVLADPFLDNLSVHCIIDGRMLSTYEKVFATATVPEPDILDLLTWRDYRKAFVEALFADGMRRIRAFENEAYIAPALPRYIPRWAIVGDLSDQMRCSLKGLRERITHSRKAYFIQRRETLPTDNTREAVMAVLERSFLEMVNLRVTEAEAKKILAVFAIRLRAVKRNHSTYPEIVDAPADPFNGNPVGYRPQDEGFVIWSVGEDERINWRWER